MKQMSRRLGRNRFNSQKTVTLRFTGLSGYEAGDYVRLDLKLNSKGAYHPLVVETQNVSGRSDDERAQVPPGILNIASVFGRTTGECFQHSQRDTDRLLIRYVMIYLATLLQHVPGLGEMWKRP